MNVIITVINSVNINIFIVFIERAGADFVLGVAGGLCHHTHWPIDFFFLVFVEWSADCLLAFAQGPEVIAAHFSLVIYMSHLLTRACRVSRVVCRVGGGCRRRAGSLARVSRRASSGWQTRSALLRSNARPRTTASPGGAEQSIPFSSLQASCITRNVDGDVTRTEWPVSPPTYLFRCTGCLLSSFSPFRAHWTRYPHHFPTNLYHSSVVVRRQGCFITRVRQ